MVTIQLKKNHIFIYGYGKVEILCFTVLQNHNKDMENKYLEEEEEVKTSEKEAMKKQGWQSTQSPTCQQEA